VPLTDAFYSTNGTAVNAALRAAVRCASVLHNPAAPTQATCAIGRVPAGAYSLMVQLKSGVVLLSGAVVTVELLVTEVVPNMGSIAGGRHEPADQRWGAQPQPCSAALRWRRPQRHGPGRRRQRVAHARPRRHARCCVLPPCPGADAWSQLGCPLTDGPVPLPTLKMGH
jgi:hypothetical protein